MADEGKLSQDEIDALLNGNASRPSEEEPDLSEEERDALGEIGNISFGSAATVLSTLLQQRVQITTPTVSLMRAEDVQVAFPRPYVLVSVGYTSGIEGSNALAIEMRDAQVIADLMLGGDGTNIVGELNDLHLSAVAEAMNQMMGGAATALSSMLRRMVNISPPTVSVEDFAEMEQSSIGLSGWIVNISFRLRVGNLIDSTIMQLTPQVFSKRLVQAFIEEMSPQSAQPVRPLSEARPVSEPTPAVAQADTPARSSGERVAEPPAEPRVETVESTRGHSQPEAMANVRQPEFVDFAQERPVLATPKNLALLYDVSLNVTVELGRTKRAIRDILDLAPGAIVELDKLAGEPVDILVNDKRIAVGEVVVIDENFGVRITDILAPADRIRTIQAKG